MEAVNINNILSAQIGLLSVT